MGEIAFYRSQYKYVKGDDSEISLEVGDILEVKKPFQFTLEGTEENPEGWILGRNQRTNENGYFPGTFVEYLRTEVLAPPTPVPQRPVPRPEPIVRNIEENNDSGYVGSPGKSVFYDFWIIILIPFHNGLLLWNIYTEPHIQNRLDLSNSEFWTLSNFSFVKKSYINIICELVYMLYLKFFCSTSYVKLCNSVKENEDVE